MAFSVREKLLDVQDVRKARDLEDLHDLRLRVPDDHRALLVHHLLGGQQDAQPGGGHIVQRAEIEDQFRDAIKEAIELNIPCVLECDIHKDDKVFPMVPAGKPIMDAFDENDLED